MKFHAGRCYLIETEWRGAKIRCCLKRIVRGLDVKGVRAVFVNYDTLMRYSVIKYSHDYSPKEWTIGKGIFGSQILQRRNEGTTDAGIGLREL